MHALQALDDLVIINFYQYPVMRSKHIRQHAFILIFLFFARLIAAVITCSALEQSEADNDRDFTRFCRMQK
jgi:hypothetical protein